MTALQGLLIAVTLGALATVGGILSNWIPRPANAKTRWTVTGLAGVVLAIAMIGLVNNESQWATSRHRLLQDWISDVNTSCEASQHRIQTALERSESAKGSQSIRERIPGLKELQAAHSDLYTELISIERPSDPNDQSKAEDWLNAYGVRRDRLARFVELVDALPDTITLTEAFNAIYIDQAVQSYLEATTALGRKSKMLGISCPH